MNISTQELFWLVLTLLVVFTISRGTQRVSQGYARVIERFGKYKTTLPAGIHFIVPFLDSPRTFKIFSTGANQLDLETPLDLIATNKKDILLQEFLINPKEYEVIASDNTKVFIDIIAYAKIIEPYKAVYNVQNIQDSIVALLDTSVRQESSRYSADTILSSRDTMNARLISTLNEASDNWGVRIIRIEIQQITFDNVVQQNLEQARNAELLRRAEIVQAQQERDKKITIAEGEKQSEIFIAEGKRQAVILEAEGKFEAARLEAEGEFLKKSKELEGLAKGYVAIAEAFKANPDALQKVINLDIATKALVAQERVAESIGSSQNAGQTLIIPTETSGLMGAIAAVTKALEFTAKKE